MTGAALTTLGALSQRAASATVAWSGAAYGHLRLAEDLACRRLPKWPGPRQVGCARAAHAAPPPDCATNLCRSGLRTRMAINAAITLKSEAIINAPFQPPVSTTNTLARGTSS